MQPRHRPEASQSIMAEAFLGARRSPRTFRADRICAAPGCATRLSIYNAGSVCASHNPHRIRPRRSAVVRRDAGNEHGGLPEVRAEAS